MNSACVANLCLETYEVSLSVMEHKLEFFKFIRNHLYFTFILILFPLYSKDAYSSIPFLISLKIPWTSSRDLFMFWAKIISVFPAFGFSEMATFNMSIMVW